MFEGPDSTTQTTTWRTNKVWSGRQRMLFDMLRRLSLTKSKQVRKTYGSRLQDVPFGNRTRDTDCHFRPPSIEGHLSQTGRRSQCFWDQAPHYGGRTRTKDL